jgi:hypothetical protein
MKRLLHFIFVLLTALVAQAFVQAIAQTPEGPFDELISEEIISSNIFLLWQESVSGNGLRSFQKVYRFGVGADAPADQRFMDIPARQDDRPVAGNRHMVVTPGKFVVSPFDYVVAAWEGQNRTIELMIPQFDTTEVMWDTHSAFTVDGPVVPTDGSNERGRIFLKSGDMNGNSLDEFALVYHGADSTIHIQVYDLDEALTPRLLASINDEQLLPLPIELAKLSVAVGDVNGNGRDEIILASVAITGTQSWAWGIKVKIYELDDSNNLIEQASEIIFLSDPDEMQISGMDFAVETGDFRNRSKHDIVLAMTFSTNAFQDDTFIYLIETDDTDGSILFNPEDRVSMQKSVNERGIIGLAVGDLNNDGRDEFVFALQGSFEVYSADEMLRPVYRSSGPIPDDDDERLSYDFISVADLDQDQRPEVIAARNIYYQDNPEQWFELVAYSVYDSKGGILDSLQLKARRTFDETSANHGFNSRRRYAIATGSFNGYGFRLGQPIYNSATNIMQPLVILNAPPVHFDVFDGVSYDVNRCYAGNQCGFIASYERVLTTGFEMSAQVTKDWGISAGVGAEGSIKASPMGIGVDVNYDVYFDVKFGRNFNRVETQSESVEIRTAVNAIEDDIIFATISDYDIWEYPAYHGNETTPRYYVLAVEPKNVESNWFPSKSWSANSYIPNHEVGNILSYPAYSNLDQNPLLEQPIQTSYTSDTFTLDANTDFTWDVDIQKFRNSQADTVKRIGFDTKANVAFVRFSADFTRTKTSTHSVSIKEGVKIETKLGGIDRTFGENRYRVTPYAYWATNGAVILDYAVRPEVSAPGGINTWWDTNYGQLPDPAFILPWRYDPEKGFGISEEAKRHQTQDVFFDVKEPVPGDTVTITARIRNFSLVDSPPVSVHFYVGDPDIGGTSITGMNGETAIETEHGIAAQRYSDVTMRWIIPSGIQQFPRIYAVLNQDAGYNEIHTNNNKGFNILGQSSVPSSIDGVVENLVPSSFKLLQSWPNPFNPANTIGYELPEQADVRLEVFNMLGQRVSVLVNEQKPAGYHEVRFDASHLASGVYIYRITAGANAKSMKMMLLK